MDNTTENNGILPPYGNDSLKNQQSQLDKQPSNTRESSECSPSFNLNLFKASFPYVDFSNGVDVALSDTHGFIVDRVMGQVQLLQDLANKITYSEDLDGQALAFTAESINRQLAVLNVVHNEYYAQIGTRNKQQEKELIRLAQVEEDLEAMMRLIDTLKAENRALKGGASA